MESSYFFSGGTFLRDIGQIPARGLSIYHIDICELDFLCTHTHKTTHYTRSHTHTYTHSNTFILHHCTEMMEARSICCYFHGA